MSVAGVDTLLADRYRLDERLAVSGTGEVWRATDTALQRAVAVRTLKPEYVADPELRARFRAEALHAAGLSHPGIATVYDFGELPEGAWLVMELVDGEPLSTLLHREGPLPPDRVLDLVAQTARALAVGHAGSVVHRHLKPGNLLVCRDGGLRVTGFGIGSATDTAPPTRTGEVVGTASYLSPEQAGGRPAGPASDLYALGVVAFECLSGTVPFPGPDQLAVARAHLQDAPPALPAGVPAPVSGLVARLLAKDPAARPSSAGALADEATAMRGAVTSGVQADTALVEPEDDDSEKFCQPGILMPQSITRTMVPVPVDDRPRPGATSTDQRRVVNGISVALALLVLTFGLRAALVGDAVEVPAVPAGAGADATVAALRAVDLGAVRKQVASATVAAGAVVALEPSPGSKVDAGSIVTVVVSTGLARDGARDEDDR